MIAENAEKNIKAERVRKGLTQEQVAKILGITKNSYNRKETGRSGFTLKEFRLLIETFKVEPHELL